MQLKTYQENTLNVLKRFFEKSRIMGHENAYFEITREDEIKERLGGYANFYSIYPDIPYTPRVCLKLPTGGGKTIIGAHAIKIVSETWQDKAYPFVIWFTPSDTIRSQTVEALKNPRHPYREVLDEQFNGKVCVWDLDEKFNIRPDDIENNACIIVATIQSFQKRDTAKYNVYKHNENLEDHFIGLKGEGMEQDEKGKIKYSFANLLYKIRPIMIVDEAHNAITNLSAEMQSRLNPSAIIELTATPRANNNTLYSVRAQELKNEEMIKLPIVLKEHNNWELAISDAIIKREELDKASENENEYIRPIILFQAQAIDEEYTVDVVKKHLLEVHNIPESEIAIATGSQKDLDGVNVFDKKCPIKYIITVEALKEGWDCSFAYILCSLAKNIRSNTAITQLLGRVMRMPYAKNRKIESLNKAYAYVLSSHFNESVSEIVAKLKEKGFEDEELRKNIQQDPGGYELWGYHPDSNKVATTKTIPPKDLPDSITITKGDDGRNIITFTDKTTDDDIEKVAGKLDPKEADELKHKHKNYRAPLENEKPSPSKSGDWVVPRFVCTQEELKLETVRDVLNSLDWDFFKYAKTDIPIGEFEIKHQGQGYVIDIDGNRISYTQSGEEQYILPSINVENWTIPSFVVDMDRLIRQPDLPQAVSLKWVRTVIEKLINNRGFSLASLVIAKFILRDKLISIITEARKKFRKDCFDEFVLGDNRKVELDFGNFKFFDTMYDDVSIFHRGTYRFSKHYLGSSKVALFDGVGVDGEEFKFAQILDSLPDVEYWLRNVAKHPNSLSFPTSEDYFYPDFVCKLTDGRTLVIEYKGEHLREFAETKEKETIGTVYEKISEGKCLFMMVYKTLNGLNAREQVLKKIGKL